VKKRAITATLLALVCMLTLGCSEDEDGLFQDNEAPVAVLQAPASISQGETVVLDASSSEDVDGVIVDYIFDLGDGEALLQSASPELLHTFEVAGVFTLALTVVDDSGTKDTDRLEVRVTER
jgi:hypothetical protein